MSFKKLSLLRSNADIDFKIIVFFKYSLKHIGLHNTNDPFYTFCTFIFINKFVAL